MKMSWKYIETIDWFDCNLVFIIRYLEFHYVHICKPKLLPHTFLNSSIIPFPFWIHEAKMKTKESKERTHTNNKTIKAKKTLVRWESFLGMNDNSGMTWGLLSKLGREGRVCFYNVSANPQLTSAWWGSIFLLHIYSKGSVAYPRL
jgi:hypothetical protein